MLDFLEITKEHRKDGIVIKPDFQSNHSKDLMVRGGAFYAIWDEANGVWSTDIFRAQQLIDNELYKYAEEHASELDGVVKIHTIKSTSTGSVTRWRTYISKEFIDNAYHDLDSKLTYADSKPKREDYASKHLNYTVKKGDCKAYERIISTLYSPEERMKIEWAIGCIVSGDSVKSQKFLVLYGDPGTGKSTILNIIAKLFDGYTAAFNAKALGSNGAFPLESLRSNPLVAIQHDGDLSGIEDNSVINSVVSHETLPMSIKYQSSFPMKFRCFLFLGTNKPVKITDAKSGILRRLIDVVPSGDKLSVDEYNQCMSNVEFELGAIAYHCLNVYKNNKHIYDTYVPTRMMSASNDFYNFIADYYEFFKEKDCTTLNEVYVKYRDYCKVANITQKNRTVVGNELKSYFKVFKDRCRLPDGTRIRNYYEHFDIGKFEIDDETPQPTTVVEEIPSWLVLDKETSLLDDMIFSCPAQYATDDEKPEKGWDSVKTTLDDLDTKKLHYVRPPVEMIVIDFDFKDGDGKKSRERNLQEASKWPPTYAEFSKGGGLHLHYIYTGDPLQLSSVYDPDVKEIEVKVYSGKSSLRRRLSYCNDIPVAAISSNLPLKKGGTKTVTSDQYKDEEKLRHTIKKTLRGQIPNCEHTKPAIMFINTLLDEAYASGKTYNVLDMKSYIRQLAKSSTHNKDFCLNLVENMKFMSEDEYKELANPNKDEPLCIFDIEVYKNHLVICWKFFGDDNPVNAMLDPSPSEVEDFLQHRLVGFNNRKYDNHILVARAQGESIEELYLRSNKIINNVSGGTLAVAYNASEFDIYDISSKKQSLKQFEIEIKRKKGKNAVPHKEMAIPWDEPVPDDRLDEVIEYCKNDVLATEEVVKYRSGDILARQILSDLAGMTMNTPTNTLTARIIFGEEKHPQHLFNYRNLAEPVEGMPYFPGYTREYGKSFYKGFEVGEGGFVYSIPGMYGRVITFDVSSMHPSSMDQENLFGPYTQNFRDLKTARVHIKHGEYDEAGELFGGKLKKYLTDKDQAKALSGALKIAINSVYGLTSAKFENPFRDPRNVDNIVAKRGALFMVDLLEAVKNLGGDVIHIKTDSIKVVDPSPEICEFIVDFGKQYGYDFEIEHIFEKICLVNDAVYIAKLAEDDPDSPGQWTATGTQFQVPYVFKKLFSKEDIIFDDMCEAKKVTSVMYLNMNEDGTDHYEFIGRVGLFTPIKPGCGGGELVKLKDGKYSAVTGTKGYRWMESDVVDCRNLHDCIDQSYYISMVDKAYDALKKYGDVDWFLS